MSLLYKKMSYIYIFHILKTIDVREMRAMPMNQYISNDNYLVFLTTKVIYNNVNFIQH